MSAILVVDDDPQVLEVVGEMLRLEGYDVATAADGREALAKFRSQEFDLVITDLIMPEKEGLETIVEMKRLRKTVPLVAMSGGGRIGPMDYLLTARTIGAAATLAKPFARSELISLVSTLLSEAES
jgi:DNA-binding response OmpR family regulator